MKTKIFKSFEDYEKWTDQFENISDYQEIPTAIDDGWKVSVDMFTECKSWKTALRRFEKSICGCEQRDFRVGGMHQREL